jgi:phenylalanyl-tRNA synthetase beta chain
MSNSLTKASYYETLENLNKEKTVHIVNPLSSDLNAMRQSMLFGGLESIKYNLNRQQQNIRVFEFGNCYQKVKQEAEKQVDKYDEKEHLALFLAGIKNPLRWNANEASYTFYTLKSYAEEILKKLNLFEKTKVSNTESELFDYVQEYSIHNKSVLILGKIDSKLLSDFDIETEVFYADFEWSTIFAMLKDERVKFTELPKFPEVKRDFALLLDEGVTFEQIKELAYKTDRKLIRDIHLFDLYKGDKIEAGKKSYGIGFTLRDDSKTLTDKQIDKVMNNLQRTFEKELGAKLR